MNIYRKSEIPNHLLHYFEPAEIGLEETPEAYVAKLVEVFREVRRVLRDDGTLWLNLGDSYSGYKGDNYGKTKGNLTARTPIANDKPLRTGTPQTSGLGEKQLLGIPWRVAFALQADGWILRQDIIWHKPNPMPESVKDRCTKAHEYLFLLAKSKRYWFDSEAIKEEARNWGTRDRSNMRGGTTDPKLKHHGLRGKDHEENPTRNRRSVWSICPRPYKGAHFAVFPPELIVPCIKAGCPETCCAKCGNGMVRKVEKTKTFESGSGRSGNKISGKQDLSASKTNTTPDIRMGPVTHTRTVGFTASCKCNYDATTPGIVLDPFAGSGTTGQVVRSLGRNAVLIELNEAYKPLIEKRLGI